MSSTKKSPRKTRYGKLATKKVGRAELEDQGEPRKMIPSETEHAATL